MFADPESPAAMVGGFYGVSAVYHDEPLVAKSFRSGKGLAWGDHHNCLFCGFDLHPASIEAANRYAKEQGIINIRFSVASAKDFPGTGYGFVTVFDALHDMGDPVGASTHIRQAIDAETPFNMVLEARP